MIKTERVKGGFEDEAVELHTSSISIELIEGFGAGEAHGYQCCIEEAEKVLEELSQKGEFAFGSFWGRSSESETSGVIPSSAIQEYDFVRYELIEIASFSSS